MTIRSGYVRIPAVPPVDPQSREGKAEAVCPKCGYIDECADSCPCRCHTESVFAILKVIATAVHTERNSDSAARRIVRELLNEPTMQSCKQRLSRRSTVTPAEGAFWCRRCRAFIPSEEAEDSPSNCSTGISHKSAADASGARCWGVVELRPPVESQTSSPAPITEGSARECSFCPHVIRHHDPLAGACDDCKCGVHFGSAEKTRELFRERFTLRESITGEETKP
jgi:hypothetical protein